ncbi:hydroxymethylbilane synthase [Vicingus serpentipes]|uniref:Multifunctional fusion protein n=1 Tax=Vicingus serpentipes TaxID=1926625 RepID=A0A5C6RS13_9FLAO|nr:hydroxymethylbilane synthase [Vicingus serpentipes]TXB65151.1 hydroxymethylbilane synthase [Vicingus serpentipes]
MDKIVGVELSHRFAPISVRERLALNKDQTRTAIQALKKSYKEVFIISTCNRLSIYAYGTSHTEILKYFDQFGNYRQYLSILPDSEIAIKNLFSTASGLESQAVGEHQISGQIKDALDLGREEKSIGPVLDELIRQAVHTGKRVRLETNIGKFSASLATVGFELIAHHGIDIANATFLVIGTGNMANLMATVLDRTNIKKLYVASHDQERAQEMASEWNGEPVDMQNMHKALSEANVIVGGTQGEINLLHEETMAESKCPRAKFALETGDKKLFIDFGVPRNFNPELKNHDNIALFDLDDIKKITYEGLLKRYDEIPEARKIVNTEVDWFIIWLKNRKVAPVIEAYWKNLEDIRDEEMKWLLPKLGEVDEHQKEVLMRFTHRLLRKISNPTIDGIKNIAQNLHAQDNPINTAKQILDVEDVDVFVPKKKIIVGTRGSKLALTQTNWVVEQLKELQPDYEFETKIIRTSGDDGDISVVGAFTSALQRSMLAGEIDIAVHSYKDIPTEGVNGLRVIPVTKRKDVRDVLISKSGQKFVELPAGSVIGTGSLRRSAQLKQIRPDLEYKFIQGNVDSRIHQMETGEYDAIILAATGLQKMNMIDIATEIFEISTMLPAVGQGILGIELVDREGYVYELVKKLRHEPTKQAADAERAFLIALGGGCNLPIAAYASIEEEEISIHGVFASEDGVYFASNTISGKVEDRKELARTLAFQLKEEIDIKKNQKIEA